MIDPTFDSKKFVVEIPTSVQISSHSLMLLKNK